MPQQTQALTQQATNLAISTPKEIDLTILVREVADTKTTVGISLRGKHGDQALFSGVCKLYKAMLSIDSKEHLSDEQVTDVKQAITTFWNREFTKVSHYGDVQSITYDKPSARIKDASVKSVSLNARIHVARELPDGQEKKLYTLILRNQAVARFTKMKDRPDLYDRKALGQQEVRVNALEKEYERIVKFIEAQKQPQPESNTGANI